MINVNSECWIESGINRYIVGCKFALFLIAPSIPKELIDT